MVRKPRYPSDSDYTTNAPSYYDDLARKNKLIQLLAEKIWEYEKTLDTSLDNIRNILDSYINVIDGKISIIDHKIGEGFNDEIEILLREWVNDGTLNHIINEEIFNTKVDKDVFNDSINSINEQLALNTNTNPTFRTDKTETLVLGDELIGTGIVTLGDGWSGDVASGFTHQSGYSSNLVISIPTLEPNTIYQVEINLTNVATGPGGQSDYWITLGNSPEFETYKGSVTRHVWGIKTVNGTQLVIIPWENYSGTMNISVKKVESVLSPHTTVLDSDNRVIMEKRFSKQSENNLYLGRYSGQNSNEFAEQNVGLGNRAMMNNTSGFWNVWLGHEALRDNTVGTRNVAIGRIALANNITGDRNVAIGSWALTRNTTGRGNIAIGADANYYNTVGSNNIAIGLVAIGGNTSGRYLIGIGDRVMSNSDGGEHVFAAGRNTLNYNKGTHNTAIGEMAGYQNREGSHNVFIGERAGMLNQTGDHIIAIGQHALYNNSAHSNIALGMRSQFNNVSGIYNISLGRETSYENEEGNYNISIGFQSQYANKGSDNFSAGRLSMREADGTDNLAVGRSSLRHIKGNGNVGIGASSGSRTGATGNYNLFIGFNSGSNHLEGDKNIIIGYDVEKFLANTSNELNIGNVIRSRDMTTGIIEMDKLRLTNLPTTAPSESGVVWNDNGTLKIT